MVKKKRLVYILHEIKIGGVEVALLSAIPDLNQRYDLKVIVLGPTVDESLLGNLSEEERNVFKCFDYSLFVYPLKVYQVADYIISLAPDYVISSLWRASWVGRLVRKHQPTIRFFSFIHSSVFFHVLDRFFTKIAIRSADAVFVDSKAAREFVLQKTNCTAPVSIISFLTFNTPAENLVSIRRQVSPNRRLCFLFLGRINKVKNLPATINFFNSLVQHGMDIEMDIYGRADDDYENARRLVNELNLQERVVFKGEVLPHQRFELFVKYDFFIQFSRVEGMAMSVVEAMQNGLVCVVTPVGEIPNYSDDGVSAVFINATATDESRNKDIDKVIGIMRDQKAYERISDACHQKFLHQPTYAKSLIRNIEVS